MKIQYVSGSLMTAPHRFILHGCNARGIMGAGVAALIRARWPEACHAYRERFENEGLELGSTLWVPAGDKVIINAITQAGYGPGEQVDYDAIERALQSVERGYDHPEYPVQAVAMPLLGCGLGGGSWKRVSAIIERTFERVHPVVYVLGQVPED